MDETEGVTIYFEFDITKFDGNPYLVDTPFGKPKVICRGDVVSERDELESQLEDEIIARALNDGLAQTS